MSRLGFRRLAKFTGTGFAHPKMKPGLPNLASRSRTPGTRIVPTGSMCFMGFAVTRPNIHAVWSPKSLAT
jgi:hypothetical protein